MPRRRCRLGEGPPRVKQARASSRCISAALPPFHSSRLIVPASHQRWSARRCQQRLAKRACGAAEGDPLEALAVVAAGDPADMAVADDADLDQPRRSGRDPRAAASRRHRARRRRARRTAPPATPPGASQRVEQQRPAAARLRRHRRPGARGGSRAAARARPAASVSPAAMAWPPPAISRPLSLAASTAAPRSTPLIDRPEPLPVPSSSSAMTIAGRPKRSLIRPATIPITPGCQPRPMTMITGASACACGLRLGLFGDQHLDRPPLLVQAVELGGDGPRFLGIGRRSAGARRGRTCRPGRRR